MYSFAFAFLSSRGQKWNLVIASLQVSMCMRFFLNMCHRKIMCINPIIPADHNPYAMFVSTEYGGHLGFFEGGVIRPNSVTWLDRLILQYSKACSEILPKFHKQQ